MILLSFLKTAMISSFIFSTLASPILSSLNSYKDFENFHSSAVLMSEIPDVDKLIDPASRGSEAAGVKVIDPRIMPVSRDSKANAIKDTLNNDSKKDALIDDFEEDTGPYDFESGLHLRNGYVRDFVLFNEASLFMEPKSYLDSSDFKDYLFKSNLKGRFEYYGSEDLDASSLLDNRLDISSFESFEPSNYFYELVMDFELDFAFNINPLKSNGDRVMSMKPFRLVKYFYGLDDEPLSVDFPFLYYINRLISNNGYSSFGLGLNRLNVSGKYLVDSNGNFYTLKSTLAIKIASDPILDSKKVRKLLSDDMDSNALLDYTYLLDSYKLRDKDLLIINMLGYSGTEDAFEAFTFEQHLSKFDLIPFVVNSKRSPYFSGYKSGKGALFFGYSGLLDFLYLNPTLNKPHSKSYADIWRGIFEDGYSFATVDAFYVFDTIFTLGILLFLFVLFSEGTLWNTKGKGRDFGNGTVINLESYFNDIILDSDSNSSVETADANGLHDLADHFSNLRSERLLNVEFSCEQLDILFQRYQSYLDVEFFKFE